MKGAYGALLLALTLAASACGDAGREPQEATEATEATDAAAAESAEAAEDSIGLGLPTPRDPSRPAGSLGSIEDSEVVVATVEREGIRLSRETVPAGEVTVVVENRATHPCNLEVSSRNSGRWRTVSWPGGSAQMGMVLSRSPYYLYCASTRGEAGVVATRDTARLVVR